MKTMLTALGLITIVCCNVINALGAEAMAPALLPQPVEMNIGAGTFTLDAHTFISAPPEATSEAQYLASAMAPATGFNLVVNASGAVQKNAIVLHLVPGRTDLGEEGYALHVTPSGVLIEAPKPAGIFYGIQTLRQLLPPQIFSNKPAATATWSIPCVEITDHPRIAWRTVSCWMCPVISSTKPKWKPCWNKWPA